MKNILNILHIFLQIIEAGIKSKPYKKKHFWFFIILLVSLGTSLDTGLLFSTPESARHISKAGVQSYLGDKLDNNELPDEIQFTTTWGEKVTGKIEYTLDNDLQGRVKSLFRMYRPDYGAFVAIKAKTGELLTLVSYSRNDDLNNIALRASFPAASIFKVVTAAAGLDTNKISPETVLFFNGKAHTLYKRNVMDNRITKGTHFISVKQAFASSVNSVFGKIGAQHVGYSDLRSYANKFGFGRNIISDIPIETGFASIKADDDWSVVEAASGFTQDNTMSPIQGAMIAASVANNGKLMTPYLVKNIKDKNGKIVYEGESSLNLKILKEDSAKDLRELMQATIQKGTSTKSFRPILRNSKFNEIEFGGKTGSIDGTNPRGRHDWFIGYGNYNGELIAVGILTIHVKFWRVKSSELARLFFQDYYEKEKNKSYSINLIQ